MGKSGLNYSFELLKIVGIRVIKVMGHFKNILVCLVAAFEFQQCDMSSRS